MEKMPWRNQTMKKVHSRTILHCIHALKEGSEILIYTGDTDVIILQVIIKIFLK